MHHLSLLRRLLPLAAVAMLTTTIAPQQAAATTDFHIEPADHSLAQFVTRQRADMPQAAAEGFAAAGSLLAHLRCGEVDAATAILRAALPTDGPAPDVAWLCPMHLWHLWTVGEPALVQPHLAALLQATLAQDEQPEPRPHHFVDAAMHVHMLLCAGSLVDELERQARPTAWSEATPAQLPGAPWRARAIARQLDLERRAWQPGRGHFRATLTAGEIALPCLGDDSVLLPNALGAQLATGARLRRHLQTLLRCEPRQDAAAGRFPPTCAWRLAAASELADETNRVRWFRSLLEEANTPPALRGFALDAAIFACTGLRIATTLPVGRTVCWSPWLPPGSPRVQLHGLMALGARFSLTLHVDPASGSTVTRVALLSSRDHGPRTIVIMAAAGSSTHELQPGDFVERALPRPQPEPQHDLPTRGRGPRH